MLLRPRFSIPAINDFVGLKEPPWADVLESCIRRVATSPNTGRRLAWHSVNSMGAEYFRQRAKDSGRSLTWRQEIVSNLETGDRRKLFFEGAEVWGSGFFPSWIDIAWMAKVRPSFLLCLPTQLLTPILCTVCHDLSTEHKLLIEARHGAAADGRNSDSENGVYKNLRRPCKTSLCMQLHQGMWFPF